MEDAECESPGGATALNGQILGSGCRASQSEPESRRCEALDRQALRIEENICYPPRMYCSGIPIEHPPVRSLCQTEPQA
ncbi:hypothetical protein NDU88_000454 [Pleurodeles waltl]|uniref:Uncharacterized protein n=1 Tax=Pleurodeles waltl TaxID=8319 RepID=A0AAV7S9K3_PLEWA|nr:hypothetical protein NDU88_000454 [Pleurodeles waltl]